MEDENARRTHLRRHATALFARPDMTEKLKRAIAADEEDGEPEETDPSPLTDEDRAETDRVRELWLELKAQGGDSCG